MRSLTMFLGLIISTNAQAEEPAKKVEAWKETPAYQRPSIAVPSIIAHTDNKDRASARNKLFAKNPEVSVNCAGLTISEEAVRSKDAARMMERCSEFARVLVHQTDADTRRDVAMAALEKGTDMYAHADEIAVGRSAQFAAGYGFLGYGGGNALGISDAYADQWALSGSGMAAPLQREQGSDKPPRKVPAKSPREIELEAENAALQKAAAEQAALEESLDNAAVRDEK